MSYVINVEKNIIYISPVPAGLTDMLMYSKSERKPVQYVDDFGEMRVKMQHCTTRMKLYHLVSRDRICVFGGMLSRVTAFFEARAFKYVIKGTHPVLPKPDYSVLKGISLRHKQDHAIAAIQHFPRGIIDAPTGFGKTWLCGLISRIWSTSNILLVSGFKSVCEGLAKEVLALNDEDEVKLHFGKYLQHKKQRAKENPRIIISSVSSMERIPANWADLILFDEAHTSPAASSMRALCRNTAPKMFGFTASPEGRSDGADDLTVALFGQIVVHVSYQEAVASGAVAQLRVLVVDCSMPDLEYEKTTEIDHVGIYRNDERSRRMIEKARAEMPPGSSILYYTKVTEHAMRIRKLFLPDVPIAHSGIGKERWNVFLQQGLVTEEDYEHVAHPDVNELERQFRTGEIKECICTTVWKRGTDFKDLDCLVRMDGEGSVISSTQVPGRVSRVGSDGVARIGTIVDCNDNFGNAWSTRFRKRRKTYVKKGWDIYEV